MNIGIVTTWFERGAAYVSREYKKVLEQKHPVFIYARGGEEYATKDKNWTDTNVTWGRRIELPVATALDLADFRNWLRQKKIDAVLFNEQHWWEPVLLCNELGVVCGAYVDYYKEETIPFFGCYDFLVCNTKRHHEVFKWHPQAFYLPWGTDLNLFKPSGLNPVHNGVVTFFHSAGRSPQRKGTDLVLKAFSLLKGACRLVIHSQVNLCEELPDTAELTAKLEHEGNLEIIVKTVSAPGLYHRGDVYVYPSRLDGIGLTVAEALACGMPVITVDCPPMNEVVNNEIGKLAAIRKWIARSDGYYWPQTIADTESIAECMQYYVTNNSKIGEFKLAAFEYAKQYLSIERNFAPLCSLFGGVNRVPLIAKKDAIAAARKYEFTRMSLRTKLYLKMQRIYPFLSMAERALKALACKRTPSRN